MNAETTYIMMTEETNEKLKEIKRSFRSVMNGVASSSMRQKGVEYKINWGVNLVELRRMSDAYAKDLDLAVALWKENIRECKILATLLMPYDKMSEELAEVWAEQIQSQEMAEMLASNLLQHTDFAAPLAFRWMACVNPMYQICAFTIISKLFAKGNEPDDREINEFLDQAVVCMQGEHIGAAHAAMNAIVHFSGLGEDYCNIARMATVKAGLDIL